jgi:hypothetical protein
MKKNLLVSFSFLLIIFFVLQRQGRNLITPQSPKGIIDLEFAKTAVRLHQLQSFWNQETVLQNIYLDFLFIIAYTWFLVTACKALKNSKSHIFSALTISAGAFDVLENFLLILVLNGKFSATVLQIVYYAAAIKFILVVIVLAFIILSLFGLFRKESLL